MKRFISALLFACLLMPFEAWAAGTVTEEWLSLGDQDFVLKLTCTADASDGSVPAYETRKAIDGWVYLMTTDPGSPAPTDNYDITISDLQGVDIAGGTLANRDTSTSEQAIPKIFNYYISRRTYGPITVAISNNSVASATITLCVYFTR